MKKLLAIVFTVVLFASLGVLGVGTSNFVNMIYASHEVISNDETRVFSRAIYNYSCEEYGYIRKYHAIVYTNTQPRELVFSLDVGLTFTPTDIHFSDDMEYIVIFHRQQNMGAFTHFEVFHNGNLIHAYSRGDLIEDSARITDCMFRFRVFLHGLSESDVCFDTMKISLTTTEDRSFVFDISSGEMSEVQPHQPTLLFFFLIFSIIAIIIAGVIIFVVTLKNKSKIEVSNEPTST